MPAHLHEQTLSRKYTLHDITLQAGAAVRKNSRRFSVSKQFPKPGASVIEYEVQFSAYKKRICQPSNRTEREGIVNKVTDLRLSPGLREKMLVVPEFLGSESLLVNEIAQRVNLGYFCCPDAFEKGEGGDRIGDYRAGIYFFFRLRCYAQV